jgi:hypothetical protein
LKVPIYITNILDSDKVVNISRTKKLNRATVKATTAQIYFDGGLPNFTLGSISNISIAYNRATPSVTIKATINYSAMGETTSYALDKTFNASIK